MYEQWRFFPLYLTSVLLVYLLTVNLKVLLFLHRGPSWFYRVKTQAFIRSKGLKNAFSAHMCLLPGILNLWELFKYLEPRSHKLNEEPEEIQLLVVSKYFAWKHATRSHNDRFRYGTATSKPKWCFYVKWNRERDREKSVVPNVTPKSGSCQSSILKRPWFANAGSYMLKLIKAVRQKL